MRRERARRGEGRRLHERESQARITRTIELIECACASRARRSRSARVGGAIGSRLGLVWPDLAALIERAVRRPCRACRVHLRLGSRKGGRRSAMCAQVALFGLLRPPAVAEAPFLVCVRAVDFVYCGRGAVAAYAASRVHCCCVSTALVIAGAAAR